MEQRHILIGILFRAPGRFFSIETSFRNVLDELCLTTRIQSFYAVRSGAKFAALLANLIWAARLKGPNLYHLTGDIHYAVLGLSRSSSVILTILDLRFLDEAGFLKKMLFWLFWVYFPCRRADYVTVISEFTKSRLLASCHVAEGKVRVIPCCVGNEFRHQPKSWPLSGIRVLHIGTTENKNLHRVGLACAGLPLRLYIVGFLSQSQCSTLSEQEVDYVNYEKLTSAQIVSLYEECDLVIFVSTYEGFGIPILEAQAVGRPVLTSNIAPMDAVAGEGALLVDPFDADAIKVGLKRLIDDESLRAELVQKGFENVAKYSAKSVAAQYAALYCEVLGRKFEEEKV